MKRLLKYLVYITNCEGLNLSVQKVKGHTKILLQDITEHAIYMSMLKG
jgi:hypothetical protein